MQASDTRTLSFYVGVVRRRLPLVALFVLACAGGAIAYSLHQKAEYGSTAHVYIKNKSLVIAQGALASAVNTLTAQRTLETQASLANTLPIAKDALGGWNADYSA